MASIVNARDVLLQAAGTRLEAVELPSNVTYTGDTAGDHTGTLGGSSQVNFQNSQLSLTSTGRLFNGATLQGFLESLDDVGGNFMGNWEGVARTFHRNDQITLSSNGVLNNAGGGAITALDYGNVAGTKPPSNATANFFTTSGSDPSGGSDGDAHWNSSTFTMWFKTGGTWRVGGTINANQITVGTLAAGRIASNSVTTDKLNVGGALSNIESNLGSVTSGTVGSSTNVTTGGQASFTGGSSLFGFFASIHANTSGNATHGIVGHASGAGGSAGVRGETSSSGGGVWGRSTGGSGSGVVAENTQGGTALEVRGRMTINNSTLVSNLRAQTCVTADSANHVAGSNVSGTVSNATNAQNAGTTNNLGGVDHTGWCRGFNTDSGTATAQSFGFGLNSTVSGVRVRASGNNMIIENFSDASLKTNIQDEDLGLSFITQLRPVTYNDIYHPEFLRHGLVANDVEETDGGESFVSTLADGKKAFDKADLIGPLINAIKELTARVEELEKQKII